MTDTLRFSIDYWDITQENKIDQVPFGFLFDNFCDVQVSDVCTRGTPLAGDTLGPLQSVNTTFVNISEQSTTGIDVAVAYSVDVGTGNLGFNLDYTLITDFDRVELDSNGIDFVTRSILGEYEYPETRWALQGNYILENWAIFAQVNYVGEFEDQPDFDFDGTLDFDTNTTRTVDSFVTLNAQLSYTGIENTVLLVGADNLLDEDPPFAVGDADTDLYGYVSSQHSPRGMFWYVRANFAF